MHVYYINNLFAMKLRNLWILILALAVLLLIFLFSKDKGENLSTEVIKVGQMSVLSSVGAEIGEEERNAVLLATKEKNEKGGIGGSLIEIISEDAPIVDLKRIPAAAQKLLNVDKVIAIVGPQWDDQASIMSNFSKENEITVISPNASTDVEAEIDSPYFFTTWPDNEVGIKRILQFAKDQGWQRIAIVQPATGSFWSYTSDLLEKNAPDYGVEIVAREHGTDFSVVDYKPLLAKVSGIKNKPDAFFGSYADLECVFLSQSQEVGLNLPLLSTESAGNPKALEDCGELMDGRLYYSAPNQDYGYRSFERSYEKEYGQAPLSPSAVSAYNAMNVLISAMENVLNDNQELNRQNVFTAVRDIKYEDGVTIPAIEFGERGVILTPEGTYVMRTVSGGSFIDIQ